MVRAVSMAITALAGAVVAAPVVSADPAAQPQAGAPCDMAEPNAQTFAKPREGTAEPDVLICVKGDQGARWQQADGLARPVHNFYTYGPTATLYPTDLNLGELWDGVGATINDICAEEQTFPGGRPSETRTNNTGQYFGFTLSPDMASLNLKGNCRWVISPCSGRTGPSPCTAGYVLPGNYPRQRET
jgi:hypothetical protein